MLQLWRKSCCCCYWTCGLLTQTNLTLSNWLSCYSDSHQIFTVVFYWGSGSGLHIAGLHLASQEAIIVFAVAEPDIYPAHRLCPFKYFQRKWLAWGLYSSPGLLLTVKVHVSQLWKHMTKSMGPFNRVSLCPKETLTQPWPCVLELSRHLLLIFMANEKNTMIEATLVY